jgi:hypothetical protein
MALAGCPTGGDMAGAVHLNFANEAEQIFCAKENSMVLVDAIAAGGDGTELVQGTHLLTYQDIIGGVPEEASLATNDHGMAQTEMRVPTPRKRWLVPVTVTDCAGKREQDQQQAHGDLQSVTLGACTHDMIEDVIAYGRLDLDMERLHDWPEFGFAYLARTGTEGEVPTPVTPPGIFANRT